MELSAFAGHNVVIAKDQPQYRPAPAYRVPGPEGKLIIGWDLTLRERLKLLVTGRLWHTVMTFNQPLQPQVLEVSRPVLLP